MAGRVKVLFSGNGVFPVNYNYQMASYIYSVLPKRMRSFLHSSGFVLNKRVFKLFVFSRIFGDLTFRRENRRGVFVLDGEAWFFVSSLWHDFLREFVHGVLKRGKINIGKTEFKLEYVDVLEPPRFSDRVRIIMLSPMVAQRTYITPGGVKKTRFFSPWEPAFCELLNRNLLNKYRVTIKYGLLPARRIKRAVRIDPLEVDDIKDRVVVIYGHGEKRKVLEGWLGKYVLRGPKTLIKVGYYAGLLYGNPKGLGMFEVI